MATSGTYNFNLDIDEIIQEATEMIGGGTTFKFTALVALPLPLVVLVKLTVSI